MIWLDKARSTDRNRSPKLSLRLFNVNFNNTYRIYIAFTEKHNFGSWQLLISEGIKESTHAFLKREETTRKGAPEYLSPVKDIANVHDNGCRKKKGRIQRG